MSGWGVWQMRVVTKTSQKQPVNPLITIGMYMCSKSMGFTRLGTMRVKALNDKLSAIFIQSLFLHHTRDIGSIIMQKHADLF